MMRTKANHTIKSMGREQADEAGYATFNRGEHICVSLARGHVTLTVVTPDSQHITIAFVPTPNGDAYRCCDIQHHTSERNDHGTPIQSGIAFGQGPTVARWGVESDPQCTLVTVLLQGE